MKNIIRITFYLALVISLTSCGIKDNENNSSDLSSFDTEDNNEGTNTKLVNIVDLTETNQIPTASALEEFYKDSENTYYFPTIKSEYIECLFSNGETMKFLEALEKNLVTISDLDTYGIHYWIIDKDGNFINSYDGGVSDQAQEICDGVPLAPEGFTKP